MNEQKQRMQWRHVIPGEVPVKEVFGYLLGGVAPRPIALVSSISADGQVNLSPFSFFNAFGANPPTIAFSPSRRLRDNTTKDTLHNVQGTRECVVQAVTYDMVQQVSLASTEYPPEVNEFEKTGLTPIASDLIRPPRVAESPFQMECRVTDIIALGGQNASGNLVICEVVKFHIAEKLFVDGVIHPDRIDLVARMSADFYCRASGAAVFVVKKPVGHTGIGYDRLPDYVKQSRVLSANNIAQLANCERIPTAQELADFLAALKTISMPEKAFDDYEQAGDYRGMFALAVARFEEIDARAEEYFERTARAALAVDDTTTAWFALMYPHRQKD